MSRGRLLIVGGGQSGLAAARAGQDQGWEPLILEAGAEPVGSWPHYYDSLRLFSPRRHSGFPGHPFPGPADDYPHRDEVVDYLRGYADRLGAEIRTGIRVVDVVADGSGFTVESADGRSLAGDALIAATGSFASPHLPTLAGQQEYQGRVLHVADYRSPDAFAGQRVLVVGAGNSAVQVAHELATVATVSLVVRDRIRFAPQTIAGRDLHWWLIHSRIDLLPPAILRRVIHGKPVLDTGRYRSALDAGVLDQRPLFAEFTRDGVSWSSGVREHVDVVIFATGYRPHLPYLRSLDILDATGLPRHRYGVSSDLPGLGYVGLEFQRSFSSNTLRGVHRDAARVVAAIARRSRSVAVV